MGEQHAEEDDTVEVGSKLATCVEGEGGAPVAAPVDDAPAAAVAPVAAAAPLPDAAPAAPALSAPRVPSIVFTHALRKDPSSATAAAAPEKGSSSSGDALGPLGDVFQFTQNGEWDPYYGRPAWCQAEIDAVNLGGIEMELDLSIKL